MKLSAYAKQLGVNYHTAWNWFKNGKINGPYQLPTGTVIVPNDTQEPNSKYGVVIYARTSYSQNKELLENQAKRLVEYAIAKGCHIKQVVKGFGSRLNDERKQLSKILQDNQYDKIIVKHKDRLTRFGFNRIEVVNESKEKDEDIVKDLISIIHCFSARIYGLRRSQRLKTKIEQAIKDTENETE